MNTVNDQRTSHNLDFSQNGGTLKNLFFFNLLTGLKNKIIVKIVFLPYININKKLQAERSNRFGEICSPTLKKSFREKRRMYDQMYVQSIYVHGIHK